MPRWLVIVLAVSGLAAAAVVDRMTSGVASGDVKEAASRLAKVPAEFGDWTSTEVPMDEKVLRVAEAAGHVSRTYTNRKNGRHVSVLLLCGPTGPIGAHEPKYCYAGGGFEMSGQPQKMAVSAPDGTTATYWSVLFAKKAPTTEVPLRVCWMWGLDGDWQASENPRSEFVLRRALYKLYVSRPEPGVPTGTASPVGSSPATADPVQEFLRAFLPEVKKALAAPTGQPK
jgi:hypothetical protein